MFTSFANLMLVSWFATHNRWFMGLAVLGYTIAFVANTCRWLNVNILKGD